MQKKVALLVLASSFLVQTAPVGAAAPKATPPAKSMAGWIIKQKMEYQGNLDIKACPQGAAVTTRNLCVYMRPDSKEILVANSENKTITKADKRLWSDQSRMNELLVKEINDPKMLKQFHIEISPPKVINGHKCTQHWAASYRADHKFWFWWEYWTADDLKLPQEIVTRWRTLIHLPDGPGIPFTAVRHFRINQPNHTEHILLQTVEVKKTTLVAADLQPPKTYKPVEDELDALMGNGNEKDELDEIFASTKKK
jgi:hypothetical protein